MPLIKLDAFIMLVRQGNNASLDTTPGTVSKTNQRPDRTTAFGYLRVTGLGGDEQPGWKRYFCKLNSVGPKGYHYINYIPDFPTCLRRAASVHQRTRLCAFLKVQFWLSPRPLLPAASPLSLGLLLFLPPCWLT